MKKILTAEEIIEKHLESDRIIDSVSMTGDYRTNNREAKKLQKLSDILQKDLCLAQEVYAVLLESDCITARLTSAAACLRLNLYISKAEQVPEELSKRDDIGVRRTNAEMALKVWREEFPGKTL